MKLVVTTYILKGMHLLPNRPLATTLFWLIPV